MKKTFKMAVLAACTVLCWGFTSCFGFVAETSGGNSENEVEYDIEQYKVRNFTVTQKKEQMFLSSNGKNPKRFLTGKNLIIGLQSKTLQRPVMQIC